MVVQIGSTKRDTFLFTSRLSSAEAIVTGNVAAEDFENSATARAGSIPLKILIGFSPERRRIIGSITKNCSRLAPIIAVKYCAIPPSIMPALICVVSCAVNATIPNDDKIVDKEKEEFL